jgi:hypothetical protein
MVSGTMRKKPRPVKIGEAERNKKTKSEGVKRNRFRSCGGKLHANLTGVKTG